MIDVTLLREQPDLSIPLLKKKAPDFDVQTLMALDHDVRSLQTEVESLRHRKNELAKLAQSGITPEIREESRSLGTVLREKEHLLHTMQEKFQALYLTCPNIPAQDIPAGAKESNQVVRTWHHKPSFAFAVKHHMELGTALGWFDMPAAATMTGSNFMLYKADAVRLMYALKMMMLEHNAEYGFSYIIPPYIVQEKSLEIAGNFPKFKDDVYSIPADHQYLIPTAEVSLANIHRNTIFLAEELPVRYTAATHCFRREAGGYGAGERGLIRIHEFEKVELFSYTLPEQSAQELEYMIACAEGLVQKLGLHYQVSLLAAQDCSFASAKTYDIEVWLPSQGIYKEISSASNCTDFQARRGAIRYRKDTASKTHLVHTLNCSSLALPRLVAALMETYQQADGTIVIPPVLKKYWL